jgi:Pyridoxamine 5'-phosphate oxidase
MPGGVDTRAVPRSDLDALPEWEPGTVAVLSVGGGSPHAIPISTAVRAGPRTVVLALALRRESLARVRQDPRCALTVIAAGDIAVTAHGRATIVEEPMVVSDRVAAVRIDVDAIQDHGQETFEIEDAVRWRWTDAEAERRDREIHVALSRLPVAGSAGGAADDEPRG